MKCSTMKAESKYDGEPITWWKCLQRATKYGGLTYTVVPSAHTVVVCVVKGGGGGGALINMGPLKVISSSFYRRIDPHSGFVCSHIGCLCCEGRGGGALVNMGS